MTSFAIAKYYFSKRKRILDMIMALSILIVFSPFFLIFYLILLLLNGHPVIFKQKRVGKNKNTYTLYKIRTMKKGASKLQYKLRVLNQAPYPMFKIKNDPRFTLIGKYLSQLGLDEVPQLYNILKGEMSFVGPRPLPVDEAQKLDQSWDFRYFVRPGILSNWALSSKRHESLSSWKKLEQADLKVGSILGDIILIFNSIKIVLLKI